MKKAITTIALLLTITSPTMSNAAGNGSSSDGKVILEMVAKSQQAQLDLVVPKNTKPGYHILTVQILDSHGVLLSRAVAFCKKDNGQIEWNNQCPGLHDFKAAKPSAVKMAIPSSTAHNSAPTKKQRSGLFDIWLILTGIVLIGGSWWFLIGRRRHDQDE
jgi:hypothetical protein